MSHWIAVVVNFGGTRQDRRHRPLLGLDHLERQRPGNIGAGNRCRDGEGVASFGISRNPELVAIRVVVVGVVRAPRNSRSSFPFTRSVHAAAVGVVVGVEGNRGQSDVAGVGGIVVVGVEARMDEVLVSWRESRVDASNVGLRDPEEWMSRRTAVISGSAG